MNIPFDIETVRVQDPAHIASLRAELAAERDEAKAAVKAPGNYKKPEAIEAFITEARAALDAEFEDKVEAAVSKTVFDGGLGQIVCIGWAIEDGAPMSHHVQDLSFSSERDMLAAWFKSLQSAHSGNHGLRPCLIGHNSNEFDLPFIWKRAMIHGIKPPHWFPRDPKPWSDTTFDTMTAWAGARGRISMDRLCKLLGIPGKGDFSGADVWPAIERGEFERVAAYCRDDVERTRAMHRRMTFSETGATVPGARITQGQRVEVRA
jgi:DNA polymerase elongation subunit (family B)